LRLTRGRLLTNVALLTYMIPASLSSPIIGSRTPMA
jgi:hypothetical protein